MTTSMLTIKPRLLSSLPRPSASSTTEAPTAYSDFLTSLDSSSAQLLSAIPNWPKGKTYHGAQTCSSPSSSLLPPGSGDTEGLKWHARVSRHSDQILDEWFEGLGKDHSVHEQEYIESCERARCVDVLEKGVAEVWEMSYKLPFPTSNRNFLILIVVFPPNPAAPVKSFRVISLPVEAPDVSTPKGAVRGRYVSVEEVKEDGQGGLVWTMATASNAGGSVPKILSEMAMPSKIAEDVPSFVGWLKKRKTAGQTDRIMKA